MAIARRSSLGLDDPPSLEAHGPVFSREARGDAEPEDRGGNVEPGEGGDAEGEFGTEFYDAGLENISEAHEERVNRGFDFVLGFP